MSKVITPHFEELIGRFVATGRFNNKSEVIRAGLRLLEEHEATALTASREDMSRVIQTALRDPRPWFRQPNFCGVAGGNQVVLYRLEPELIRVLRILNAAQDWTRFFGGI